MEPMSSEFHVAIGVGTEEENRINDETTALYLVASDAIRAAKKHKMNGTPIRLELYENGLPVFWSYGETVEEAVQIALQMNKKSRRGGGR